MQNAAGTAKEGATPVYSTETQNDGTTSFTGLKPGYYKLAETTAPAGYNLTNETMIIQVKVENNEATVVQADTGVTHTMITYENDAITVKNNPGVELPATGGPGTLVYTVTGLTLTVGAALWLILRRKREQN